MMSQVSSILVSRASAEHGGRVASERCSVAERNGHVDDCQALDPGYSRRKTIVR